MQSGLTLHKQNGAVLLVSLVILLIMTVIGTSGMTSVTMEERMVSNMYDDNLSFQTAESGLRDCENYLGNMGIDASAQQRVLNSGAAPDETTLIWQADEPEDGKPTPNAPKNTWSGATGLTFWWQDPQFWATNGMEYSAQDPTQINLAVSAQGRVAANPRCIREYVGFQSDDKQETKINGTGWYHYQSTTAATGADIRSMSVVQSAYFKRLK